MNPAQAVHAAPCPRLSPVCPQRSGTLQPARMLVSPLSPLFTEPTKPMQVEATTAGHYESPQTKRNFPRLQTLMIKDLVDGKARSLYPNIESGGVTFKKAKVESNQEQKKLF